MQTIIENALRRIRETDAKAPLVGLILGSGLGGYADTLVNTSSVDYSEIQGFPHSNVEGHAARFVLGEKMGLPVIAMQGRLHYYEGHSQAIITTGVRCMRALGAKYLILTNAAGGVNTSFEPGDMMLISDHINFSGSHPLIGENMDQFGPRFPDLSNVYDRELRESVKRHADKASIPIREGVYMMFSGPSYETPAEIRMARICGADAVGMSTVPEAITAAHCGMQTIGISLITNMAAGVLRQTLTHEEVQRTAAEASLRFTALIDMILEKVLQ